MLTKELKGELDDMSWKEIIKYQGPDIEDIMEIEEDTKRRGGELDEYRKKELDDRIKYVESLVESFVNTKEYKDREKMRYSISKLIEDVEDRLSFDRSVGVRNDVLNEYYDRLREASKKAEDSMNE